MAVSALSEWILGVHRFVWYPLFYAMGLERDAIDAPIGGWRRAAVHVTAGVKKPAVRTRAKRKKA